MEYNYSVVAYILPRYRSPALCLDISSYWKRYKYRVPPVGVIPLVHRDLNVFYQTRDRAMIWALNNNFRAVSFHGKIYNRCYSIPSLLFRARILSLPKYRYKFVWYKGCRSNGPNYSVPKYRFISLQISKYRYNFVWYKECRSDGPSYSVPKYS